MVITTKDYGLKAYLVLKYNGVATDTSVTVVTDKDEITLKREYNLSDFSLYNDILKSIIKKS